MPIKKIAFFSLLILCLFVINNLVHSISALWQKKNLILNAQVALKKEKNEQEILQKKLQLVTKPQFIEEEARNKLTLGKSGEGIILIPTQQLQASPSAMPTPQDKRQNWEKWRDLLF